MNEYNKSDEIVKEIDAYLDNVVHKECPYSIYSELKER